MLWYADWLAWSTPTHVIGCFEIAFQCRDISVVWEFGNAAINLLVRAARTVYNSPGKAFFDQLAKAVDRDCGNKRRLLVLANHLIDIK